MNSGSVVAVYVNSDSVLVVFYMVSLTVDILSVVGISVMAMMNYWNGIGKSLYGIDKVNYFLQI